VPYFQEGYSCILVILAARRSKLLGRPKVNIQEYLRPKLVGRRFESHSVPLDMLRDLAVLEEMAGEVAKWKFLQANRDRRRSPRGFSKKVTIVLTGVEEGSAIPVLALMFAGFFPPAVHVYYEQARDAIVAAIRAADSHMPPSAHLPEKALAYFDRFGRSLRDGEAIEFATDDANSPARLTKEVRRRLLLASKEVKEVTEEIELRGVIHEANQETMTFQVTLADGSKVSGPIATPHFDNIIEVFRGYKQGTKIHVQGVGRFNRNQRLQGIESIEHTTILDPQDIPARFDELKLLRDGWLDDIGLAPSPEGLDWLAAIMAEKYPDTLPLPYAYPIAEGGIQFEWPISPHEPSLEINLNSKTGEWHDLNLDTGEEEEKPLDLREETDWMWLIGRLTEMVGAKHGD
jgi:hypothetical protein